MPDVRLGGLLVIAEARFSHAGPLRIRTHLREIIAIPHICKCHYRQNLVREFKVNSKSKAGLGRVRGVVATNREGNLGHGDSGLSRRMAAMGNARAPAAGPNTERGGGFTGTCEGTRRGRGVRFRDLCLVLIITEAEYPIIR